MRSGGHSHRGNGRPRSGKARADREVPGAGRQVRPPGLHRAVRTSPERLDPGRGARQGARTTSSCSTARRSAATSASSSPTCTSIRTPSTFTVLPWRGRETGQVARIICDVADPDGTPFAGDPRVQLKKVLADAKAEGFDMQCGPEAEFFLFRTRQGRRRDDRSARRRRLLRRRSARPRRGHPPRHRGHARRRWASTSRRRTTRSRSASTRSTSATPTRSPAPTT